MILKLYFLQNKKNKLLDIPYGSQIIREKKCKEKKNDQNWPNFELAF